MLVSQGQSQPSLKDFGIQEMATQWDTDGGSMVKMEDPSMTEKEFFGNDYPHQVPAYSMDAFHQAKLKPSKPLDFEFEGGFDTGYEDYQVQAFWTF